MKKSFELTVAICVYNITYLKRLLNSLKKQSYKKALFLFIIDNPDKSIEISNIIKNYNLDYKIITNKKNLGAYTCYDISLKKSKTKFFLRVDDDDFFSNKNYLEVLINEIKKGYDYVLPNIKIIYSNSNKIKYGTLIYKNCITKRDFVNMFFKESAFLFYPIFVRSKYLKLHKMYFSKNLYGEGILNLRVASSLKGIFLSKAIYCYFRHINHNHLSLKPIKIYYFHIKMLLKTINNIYQIKEINISQKIIKSMELFIKILIALIKIITHSFKQLF